MNTMRRRDFHRKEHSIFHTAIVFICLTVAQFVYGGDKANLDGIEVSRESAELCLETASTLEEALNYLDKTVDMSFMSDINTLHNFSTALQKDIKTSTEKRFLILSSNTLEQIGNFGLGKIPDVVDALKTTGKLPSSFNLPATFGAEELTTAVSRHIGSGRADIDTITNYLDGLNKTCWAIVGYMVGGPEGARVYQSIAGTGAKLLRKATLPIFNKAVLTWRGQGEQLVKQWHKLQERRIYDGLSVQKITEVYGEALLIKNGLSRKNINQLNAIAYDLNQNLTQMKKDLNINKIEGFKQSEKIELGGIYIDPELIYAGRGGKEVREEVLDFRPSEDSLTWPVKIPEEEE